MSVTALLAAIAASLAFQLFWGLGLGLRVGGYTSPEWWAGMLTVSVIILTLGFFNAS